MPRVPGPIHLKPQTDLAERVLLPGDPHRALAVAQALLERPLMFNHHRGLWGYTGTAADGEPLTIQATGMGGPSAAIVVSELAALGARRVVRIGTCGALDRGLALGELIAVDAAIAADGTSRALGAGELVAADPALTEAIEADRRGTIVTTDLFYDERDGIEDGWRGAGAIAVEMEAATVLRLGERLGLAAGCVLLVSDLLGPPRERIAPDDLEAAAERLGRAGLAALSP